MNKFCLLIPVFNHGDAMARLLVALEPLKLACLVVDDGSDGATQAILRGLARSHAWVSLLGRDRNGGKGAAVKEGLLRLAGSEWTHVIQMDADGQHDAADVPRLMRESMAHPEALVLGEPSFHGAVPRARIVGRQLSRFWVWVETLSLDIADPLVGFRVYPLAETAALLRRHHLGSRMDFDPEIAVRLHWSGMPIRNVPIRIDYPADGKSHFRLWRDNLRITWMHTFLCLGMLLRLPRLIGRWRRVG